MIRIGVIGAGALAERHAAAFEAAGGASVVVGGPELLDAVDAAVVASEPELRFHHTALALEHGLDVLIEQPVAPTVENARMLDRIASLRPSRPVVQVSHADRFNVALARLTELLSAHEPVAVAIRSLGSSGGEALHDVHTLLSLARSPLVRLQASGGPDHQVATLVFENGLIGTLTTGSAAPAPIREIVATSADAVTVVDLLAFTVELTRADVRECARLEPCDPLVVQARSFLAAVQARQAPDVTLRAAIACLEVRDAVQECLAVQAATTGSGGVTAR